MPVTAGQVELRSIVAAAGMQLHEGIRWEDEPNRTILSQARIEAGQRETITRDVRCAQDLRWPAISPTYAWAQRHAYPSFNEQSALIDADALVYDCWTGSQQQELPAWSGGESSLLVYGALCTIATGAPVRPRDEPFDAIYLRGSRVLMTGRDGGHHTLAAFLWGEGVLRGNILVIHDEPDHELLGACQLIDWLLPRRDQGLVLLRRKSDRRDTILRLARRLREQLLIDLSPQEDAAPPTPATGQPMMQTIDSLSRLLDGHTGERRDTDLDEAALERELLDRAKLTGADFGEAAPGPHV